MNTELILGSMTIVGVAVAGYLIYRDTNRVRQQAILDLEKKIEARKAPTFASDPVIPPVRTSTISPKPTAKAAPATRSQPKPTATASPARRYHEESRRNDNLLDPLNPLSVSHPLNPANPLNLDNDRPSRSCEPSYSEPSRYESSRDCGSSGSWGGSSSSDSGSSCSTSSSSCD